MKIIHLLPANTLLPADTGPISFSTVVENQAMIEIEVWEANSGTESDALEDHVLIGRGLLHLPPGGLGRAIVHVTFHVSEDGLLTVTATNPDNAEELEFDLTIGMDERAVRRTSG
jgi:molecular chaperone DnaK